MGRTDEVTELVGTVQRHRLVTLVGVGGVGKSRLAEQVAEHLPARAFDAVYGAPLWSLSGPALLPAVVADACGLSDHSPREPLDALGGWIGDRSVLLVLDSCEHLVDHCAALVAELQARCGKLTVLATSRQRLGLAGERVHQVAPLAPDAEAMELFTSAAADVGVHWDDPGDLVAAVEVCRRLEGIPLALRLAAAQLPQRPVRVLAATLRTRLSLTAPADTAARPLRHHGLGTTIGWSHELCEPAERLLWARLSVFRCDATPEAVLRVCAHGPLPSRALAGALAGLERKSLVSVARGRVRMLDTVREYGAMWLAELGESDAVADRHAGYFADVAATADRNWWGPRQADAYTALTACHEDLCAAMERLLLTRPAEAVLMAGRVGFFWACCGRLHEAGHYLEEFTGLVAAPSEAAAKALWALGVVRTLQGDHEAAAALGRSARAAAVTAGSSVLTADAGYLQGLVLLLQGRPLAALDAADRELSGGVGSQAVRARCLLVRVFGLTGSGQLEQARAEAEALRERAVRDGEWWTRSYTDHQLAVIALYQDRPDDALGHAEEMIRGKQRIGDVLGLALGLDVMAAALAARGAGRLSARAYGAGQALWETVGQPQRGTPELASLRDRSERSARQLAGDAVYDEEFTRSRLTDPQATLAALLGER